MDQKQALELVKPHLTEGRYIHTVGVMETAIFLAEQYGEVRKKQKQQQSSMIMPNTGIRMK